MGRRLVRDRALDNWVVPGAEHQVRPVTGPREHVELLHAKLIEECMEVIQAKTKEEITKEVADVMAVLDGITYRAGITYRELLDTMNGREKASGEFRRGMVWETGR